MSSILRDGKQAGVEQLQWCGKYGFHIEEMFGKQNSSSFSKLFEKEVNNDIGIQLLTS
jgi:hypothetical protein